jgi:hypothetical protein
MMRYSLGRVSRVNDDGVFGFVIYYEVGIVVTLAHPLISLVSLNKPGYKRLRRLTHRNRLDMHCAGKCRLESAIQYLRLPLVQKTGAVGTTYSGR